MNNDPNQISSSSDNGSSVQDEANSSAQSADGSSSNQDTGRSADEGDESTEGSSSTNASTSSQKDERLDSSSYKDYSHLPSLPPRNAATLAQANARKEPTFPVKLHMILSNKDLEEIICWLPHGRSWRILQQKRFELQVIPHYFTHGRYASFARQVNVWGFKRVIHGTDYGSYYHPLFLRGIPHLTDRMRRLTQKAVTKGLKSQLESGGEHLDFYAITAMHPLPDAVPLSLAADGTVHPAVASAARETSGESSGASQSRAIHVSEIAELVSIEKRRNELLRNAGGDSSGDSRKAPPVESTQGLSQAPMLEGSLVDPEVLIQTVLMLASKLPNGLFSLLEIIQPLARQEQMLRQNGGTIPGSNVHVVQPPTQNSLSLESVLQALCSQDRNQAGTSTVVPVGGRNEMAHVNPSLRHARLQPQPQPPQNQQNNVDDATLRLLASFLSGNANGSNQP